ncbi:MAG: type 1 glutamine amidotransferase [Acidobacteria bacterium]|nr:type 1 glutamine amidotransferase [Acidobacteriota bacterium]
MKPVLVLLHGDDIPLGLFGEALDIAGVPRLEVMLHDGATIPPLTGFSALVVLGGVMGVYDEGAHPWLADEKRAIVAAHAVEMPMLGICLGSQLFAEALGGSAFLSESAPEIAHMVPRLTEAGAEDPVLRHFDEPVVVFHQDTWDPPPGATLLATSERFNHAFRLGSALAIQAHPEADAAVVAKWVEMEDELPLMLAAGVDPDQLVAEVAAGEAAQREMAARLFGAWVEEVVRRQSSVSGQPEGDERPGG